MTDAELRTIVSDAVAAFGPAVIEEAYQAAAGVPQGDDPHAYAREVAEAVGRVLEAVLAVRRAALQREMEIQRAIVRATQAPVGALRH